MNKSIRTNNDGVVENWKYNRTSHSNNKQLTTDGQNLYSYRQLVGITLNDGTKVSLNYMRAGKGIYISQTTSHHVSKAHDVADVAMNPDVALEAALITRI